MANSSAVSRDPSSIRMEVKRSPIYSHKLSPVIRIGGFPWRLCYSLQPGSNTLKVSLMCYKSRESELWWCKPTLTLTVTQRNGSTITQTAKNKFASWKKNRFVWIPDLTNDAIEVEVKIENNVDGESFRLRPEPALSFDCCLVVAKKRFKVNKQSLASQSSYFNALFFGDFKEKNQKEIEIKDVDPEDFAKLLAMVDGKDTYTNPTFSVHSSVRTFVNGESPEKWLQLADRFDLKIAEDLVANYILWDKTISVVRKLQLFEMFRLETLKSTLDRSDLVALANSPDCSLLSPDLMLQMFRQLAAACEE